MIFSMKNAVSLGILYRINTCEIAVICFSFIDAFIVMRNGKTNLFPFLMTMMLCT